MFLSRNDGSFSIHKFALSDDEVNYNIIRHYGRSVGREKIEKNTPVFEALTNGNQAQKYKLITASNQYLIKLPSLTIDQLSVTNSISLGFGTGSARTSTLTVQQKIVDEVEIPIDMVDSSFVVEMSNLFLQTYNARPENIDGQQRATYILNSTSDNSQRGAILQFTLALKSISDSLFSVYGTTLNKSQINTYVKITGLVSGAVKEFTVIITK
jgi:hypothetical protein